MKTFTESASLDELLEPIKSISDSIHHHLTNSNFSIFSHRIDPHNDVDIYFYFNHYPTNFEEIKNHLDDLSKALNTLPFKEYFTYEMDTEWKEEKVFHTLVIKIDYKKLIEADFYKNLVASLKTGKKFNL